MGTSYILIAEDDPDDQYLIRQAIRECSVDIQIDCISDGHYALDYLSQRWSEDPSSLPKVIFLDLNMPSSNGKIVLKTLKSEAKFKHIPVIIFTTSNSEQDVKECYEFGANGYVVKPLGYPELLDAMDVLCRHWLQIVTLPGSTEKSDY